jgi:FtsH-binding integral membrane protein
MNNSIYRKKLNNTVIFMELMYYTGVINFLLIICEILGW